MFSVSGLTGAGLFAPDGFGRPDGLLVHLGSSERGLRVAIAPHLSDVNVRRRHDRQFDVARSEREAGRDPRAALDAVYDVPLPAPAVDDLMELTVSLQPGLPWFFYGYENTGRGSSDLRGRFAWRTRRVKRSMWRHEVEITDFVTDLMDLFEQFDSALSKVWSTWHMARSNGVTDHASALRRIGELLSGGRGDYEFAERVLATVQPPFRPELLEQPPASIGAAIAWAEATHVQDVAFERFGFEPVPGTREGRSDPFHTSGWFSVGGFEAVTSRARRSRPFRLEVRHDALWGAYAGRNWAGNELPHGGEWRFAYKFTPSTTQAAAERLAAYVLETFPGAVVLTDAAWKWSGDHGSEWVPFRP